MSKTRFLNNDGKPRLVIGIPTFNRPERCSEAIKSVIGQSVPTRVIVANQGGNEECLDACQIWMDHPNFSIRESPATTLWENWKWVAEQAVEDGAEFFTWLQDDDQVAKSFARRVCRSFDYFSDCNIYCARLAMSYDNGLGCHWTGNYGPRIPMDLLNGQPTNYPGLILLPIAYFDGWGMSPAKSFRVGPAFKEMLRTLPGDCDCFTERLDCAWMGCHGGAIADPAIAGYWIMHGRNGKLENTSQTSANYDTIPAQLKSAYSFLDDLMDQHPEWRQMLLDWMHALGNVEFYKIFHGNMAKWRDTSQYAAQMCEIFEDSLEAYGIKVDEITKPMGLSKTRTYEWDTLWVNELANWNLGVEGNGTGH